MSNYTTSNSTASANGQRSQSEDTTYSLWNSQEPHLTALDAARRLGWSVVPLNALKKPPVKWKQYQTEPADEETIQSWYSKFTPSAWAVVTGTVSGIVTLDFDGEQGAQTLEKLGLKPHRRTGSGGFHIDFKHPGWRVKTLNHETSKDRPWSKLYPGLDIRGDGGYAAFCGSNQNGQYIWLREPEPEDLALLLNDLREFLDLLHEPITKRGRPRQSQSDSQPGSFLEQALKRIEQDGRNNAGFWLARTLRNNGFSRQHAEDIMKDYQGRVPQTNAKGEAEEYTMEEALASLASAYNNSRERFILEGQLYEKEGRALEILAQANGNDPKLFVYLSTISKVAKDEQDKPIIMQLDRAGVKHGLSLAADFFTKRVSKGEIILTEVHPPQELAEQILALAPNEWPLPALKAIVEAPVLRPDGSILDKPGYDERTKLYYVPSPGMDRCKIPSHPTREDAIAAMNFLRPMFADFPFEGQADLANTFALLFTPLVRHAVKGDIQMGLIDATNAGTGKGLIVSIVSIVATGEETDPMAAKNDDDEWRKAILAKLLPGPRIITIDNIRGVLESQALEMLLTGGRISERILGQSKNASPKNEATWMATGNNLLIGGDLPRRCYRIRLIAEQANPDERPEESFTIPRLKEWVYEHRPEIVSEILTIARAWYAAGKPKASTNPLGSSTFADWGKTVGGMLEYAGMEGFQQNKAELRSRNSEEAAECEAFLSAWYANWPDIWMHTREIANKIKSENNSVFEPSANSLLETLPQYLKKSMDKPGNSFEVTLSIWLGRRIQTKYGTQALSIERDTDPHTKGSLWRVVRRVAESHNSTHEEEKNNNYNAHTHAHTHAYSGGGENPPQPSDPPQTEQYAKQGNTTQGGLGGPFAGFTEFDAEKVFAEGLEKPLNGHAEKINQVYAKIKTLPQVFWRLRYNGYMPEVVSPQEYVNRLADLLTRGDENARRDAEADIEGRLK